VYFTKKFSFLIYSDLLRQANGHGEEDEAEEGEEVADHLDSHEPGEVRLKSRF